MESLIFGHERGAFTGADARKRGQLELAGAGTVLLDEMAEMPLHLQTKLLRVLEDRRFRPLGAAAEIPLRARVLASTHANLEQRLIDGTLREDLFYRLNVVAIVVPSLAERKDDIPELVHAFASTLPRKIRFTDDAMAWLVRRSWPGNVRELKNGILRMSLLAEEDRIDSAALQVLLGEGTGALHLGEIEQLAARVLALPDTMPNKLDVLERAVLTRAMAASAGVKIVAARLVGLERKAFDRHWLKLGQDDGSGAGDDVDE
jgi:DNA-binding NtrC family response regulator